MLPIAKLPMPGPLGYGPHPRIKSGAGSSPLPRGEGTLHTPSKLGFAQKLDKIKG